MGESSDPRREPIAHPSQQLAPADDNEDGAPPPEVYDPANYRWVPVRRRPRYDGWTEEKMRRFIEVLADTGLVGLAARQVGMSRESAYKLRRAAHAAAFARAWDAARHHAGGLLEDVAFERAVEGVEHNVCNEYGEVISTRRVHNDRLLMFLLRHLKPERYAADALACPAPQPETVEASLREMEPRLPAPPAELLGEEALGEELQLADIADGALPRFLSEQRPARSAGALEAEAQAARERSGEAAWDKLLRKDGALSNQEFADLCRTIEPAGHAQPPRRRYR